jgi:hypothetical protein
MDAGAIATISTSVVALTQLIKWAGLPDSKGPISVMVLSVLGVVFWGWSVGTLTERTQAFQYFAAWILVATSAAGVFGFTRAAGSAMVKTSSPPAGAGAELTVKGGSNA